MTSDASTAYVWIWLPDAEAPVVAGRVDQRADRLIFGYGRSYLERPDAISIYEPELPLRPGPIEPLPTLQAAGCLLEARTLPLRLGSARPPPTALRAGSTLGARCSA